MSGLHANWPQELLDLYAGKPVAGRSGAVFEGLGSLSTRRNLHFLRAVMLVLRPIRTIEIGLALGGSALAIAATHRELGATRPDAHTAIDLAQSGHWDGVASLLLTRAGLDRLVRIIERPSSLALAALACDPDERFDMAYVDGSHQFEDVFVDFYFLASLLRPGAIVLFDDCSDPHVAKALRFISRNRRETFEDFPLDPFLEGLRERARRRLAGWLGRRQMRAFRKRADGPADRTFVDF